MMLGKYSGPRACCVTGWVARFTRVLGISPGVATKRQTGEPV